MNVRDVCAVIDVFAPPALAYEWDRAGLSIGRPDAEVTGVLVALTVTRPVFEAAREAGAELIISHHPLLWEPFQALRTDDPMTRLCLDIAQAGISCYAAHTCLDVAPGGVSALLAARLGLTNVRPLFSAPQAAQVKLVAFVPETHVVQVRDAVCRAGAGVIGDYTYCTFSAPGTGTFLPGENTQPFSGEKHRVNEERELRFEVLTPKARLAGVLQALNAAHPYEEAAYDIVCLDNRDPTAGLGVRGELPGPVPLRRFADHVRAALDLSHVRMAGHGDKAVLRVAAIGGAGGREIMNLPGDVDVLLTGDIGYHEAHLAESRGVALVDAGHAGTEKCVVPALADYLARTLSSVGVSSYVEPDVFTMITA